ncbi:hypothetical protein E4U58_001081 [Claviceps cyperi]|nr:hypothetical protein E4U58_001081 [Claviceps cyperi]
MGDTSRPVKAQLHSEPEPTIPSAGLDGQHQAVLTVKQPSADATGDYQGNLLEWNPDEHEEIAQQVEVDYPDDEDAYEYPEAEWQHDYEDERVDQSPSGGQPARPSSVCRLGPPDVHVPHVRSYL